MPTAALKESGTAIAPIRLALAIEGRAPVFWAARSQSSQARDPVTVRLGPRLSPMSSAKGRGGTRAASSEAAGRLLTRPVLSAATAAVAHGSRWASRRAGPDHVRPNV